MRPGLGYRSRHLGVGPDRRARPGPAGPSGPRRRGMTRAATARSSCTSTPPVLRRPARRRVLPADRLQPRRPPGDPARDREGPAETAGEGVRAGIHAKRVSAETNICLVCDRVGRNIPGGERVCMRVNVEPLLAAINIGTLGPAFHGDGCPCRNRPLSECATARGRLRCLFLSHHRGRRGSRRGCRECCRRRTSENTQGKCCPGLLRRYVPTLTMTPQFPNPSL